MEEDDNEEEVIGFPEINIIPTNGTIDALLNVKFASFTRPIKFDLVHAAGSYPLELTPPVGELINVSNLSSAAFLDLQSNYFFFLNYGQLIIFEYQKN